jgi:hypothetical protein
MKQQVKSKQIETRVDRLSRLIGVRCPESERQKVEKLLRDWGNENETKTSDARAYRKATKSL